MLRAFRPVGDPAFAAVISPCRGSLPWSSATLGFPLTKEKVMQRALLAGVFMLGAMCFAASAQQIRVNFQGDCKTVGNNISCTFDASKPAHDPTSCPGGANPLSYWWSFGDNMPPPPPQVVPTIQHNYPNQPNQYSVDLEVFCPPGGPNDNLLNTRVVNVNWPGGCAGCIFLDVGFN
jgi:hypothetical protein